MNQPPKTFDDVARTLTEGCTSVIFISISDSQVRFRDAAEASRFAVALYAAGKSEVEVQLNLPPKAHPYVSWLVPGRVRLG